jgi:hypothetical protein
MVIRSSRVGQDVIARWPHDGKIRPIQEALAPSRPGIRDACS